MASLKVQRQLAGFYKVYGVEHFANVKLETSGEHKGKWCGDIRRNSDGALIRFAGVWNTKREAVEEAAFILERL